MSIYHEFYEKEKYNATNLVNYTQKFYNEFGDCDEYRKLLNQIKELFLEDIEPLIVINGKI